MKPILFSTPMVQAINDGRKTQTRRIIKPTPILMMGSGKHSIYRCGKGTYSLDMYPQNSNIIADKAGYQIGDILYVRETWLDDGSGREGNIHYKASATQADLEWLKSLGLKWKPSIHMPKAYARIFLKVTNVRVERLQDISEEDAIAEGIEKSDKPNGDYLSWKDYFSNGVCSPRGSYRSLWRSINGKDAWKQNPYVFVYEFERVAKPEVVA